MTRTVELHAVSIDDYAAVGTAVKKIREAADGLQGKRILHLNATSHGGGVAEILRSEVPLLRSLGVEAEWQVIEPPDDFFAITKKLHNALQGEKAEPSVAEWKRYEGVSKRLAKEIDPSAWDAIIIHDPQPALIPHFHPRASETKWIWRCHLDSSHPYAPVHRRLVPFLAPYSGGIFSLDAFRLPGFKPSHVAIIPPAIDPLSDKNQPMSLTEAASILNAFPFDPRKPSVTQVSRFDQWKDPLGVLEAWRMAKQEVPDMQLALVGGAADDDPEGPRIVKSLLEAAQDEQGLCILVDAADDRAVKAFQTASTVILQKSLREGFGLTVTEALWAGTPVVAGDVGGIPLQIENGKDGYLVSTIPQAAKRIVEIVSDPALAKRMGEAGRQIVKEKFLLPRLVADDLRLVAAVLRGD